MKKDYSGKKLIRPITLVIEPNVWQEFKSKVTRDKTLNEAVIDLIKEHNSSK